MNFLHAQTRYWTAILRGFSSVWFEVVIVVHRQFAQECCDRKTYRKHGHQPRHRKHGHQPRHRVHCIHKRYLLCCPDNCVRPFHPRRRNNAGDFRTLRHRGPVCGYRVPAHQRRRTIPLPSVNRMARIHLYQPM